MGYRVSGILKLPDGSPAANAEIEFISRKNYTPLVQELKSNIKCSATGAYDVILEYGEYAVVVYPGGTYPAALGTIILAADTVAGQDLPTLLQQAGWQPATPEYIQQITQWLAEANASASAALASELAAKVSESNAKASENAALSSKGSAASSASTATTKATEAASSASAALASKNAAATSETNALSSKNAAAASASTATSAASSATSSASAAAGSESTALSAATRAEQAAQIVTGALVDAGPYNAASGILPTPSMSSGIKHSSIWKVTGSGTAGGIELSIGDSLVYTSSDNSYYKIDNTESFAEALQAAALPFPDVWLPLNDSLRLLAGFGDEIKVGDYTVATQANPTRNSDATLINKSGQLVNAAINGARFENEGLLVEPIKTNICRWDSVRIPSGGASPSDVVSLAYPDITAKKVVGGAATIALGASKEIVKSLTKYSATAVIDLKNSTIPNNKLRLQFAYSAAWGGMRYIDIDTITLSVYSPNGTTGTAKLVGDLLEITATTASGETAESSGGGSVDLYYIGASGAPAVPPADGSVCIVMFQLEEGDPTSVIVTANSAVTRAADKLTIPRLNNECVEWYSGADPITPIVTADTIELVPPAGKRHLRNVRGFFTALTAEQKAALK